MTISEGRPDTAEAVADPYYGAVPQPFKAAGLPVRVKVADESPAALFTSVCIALFVVPGYLTYRVGQDANVRYWIGDYFDVVVVLPCLYLAAHLLHLCRGGLVRSTVFVCLVGSAGLLLGLGNVVLLAASSFGSAFLARDCYALPQKQALQVEWEAARDYLASCATDFASKKNVTYAHALDRLRIGDCPGYAARVAEQHVLSWPYLQVLEESYLCSGWCAESSSSIWTFQSTHGACSPVVADILVRRIQLTMLQVSVYCLVVVLSAVPLAVLGAPAWLTRHSGFVWAPISSTARWGSSRHAAGGRDRQELRPLAPTQ